jgi:hypothetical protein
VETLEHIRTAWRRAFWRRQGEQHLVDTFWPSDYPIGTSLWHHGQQYLITRYDCTPDARLFSVWAKPVIHATAAVHPDPRIKRLIRISTRVYR